MYELMLLAGSFGALWAVLAWLACGLFAGHVAAEKGRWGMWWFFMGILFGPLALIAAVGLPDRNILSLTPSPKTHVTCPDCAEFVRNEAVVCCHCGCKLVSVQNNGVTSRGKRRDPTENAIL